MTATRSRTPDAAATEVAEATESTSMAGAAPAKTKAKGKVNPKAKAKAKAGNPAAKAKLRANKKAAAADKGAEGGAAAKAAGKQQLVRDSFTIPKNEYHALDQLKKRAMALEHDVRKGELLRAGILALTTMDDAHLLKALQAVPTLKTGRPKREKPAAEAADSSED